MTAVIAHRGASSLERENTLAAFVRAGEVGADAVELDVRRCADGTIAVHHDPELVDGRLVREVTGAALPSYVPTLDAALDASSGMWVNIEIKTDPADADPHGDARLAHDVSALLSARGEPQRWLVSSFSRSVIERCRSFAPSIRTALVCDEVTPTMLLDLAERGHAAVHPHYRSIDASLVARCHRLGLAVNVWTCDDPDAIVRLASWGVDGICTNVPDVAVRILRGDQHRPR